MRDRKIHHKYDPVRVGKGSLSQVVTPSRAPTAYLTGSYESSPQGYIPVDHRSLERKFLYGCALGTISDGRVVSISTTRHEPGSIETHLAKVGKDIDTGYLPCFCALIEKKEKDPESVKSQRRHERRLRQMTGASL